ncbi:MAG: fasciclin domain-containing protein [Caulobacteraceae bacterium]|nr:fasciclin domain-containing protein [Caulobacteraceae bacterium]
MHLTRLMTTAAAAALLACPALAAETVSEPAPAPPPAAAPAAPAAALPSIPKVAPGPDIYETLKASGQFAILVKALETTNLKGVLKTYPNLTFFAPTDAAFNALPPDVLAKLTGTSTAAANQMQQILKYCLINAQVDSSKIKGAKGPVTTVEGASIQLDGSNPDDLLVNNADIIQADVRTANGGIVHVIDKLVVPSDSPYYATLASPAPPAAPAPAAASGG